MAICNSKLLAYQRVCYNPLGMRIQVGNRKTFGGAETIQGGMKLLGSGSRGWKPYMNLKILLSFRPCAQIFFFRFWFVFTHSKPLLVLDETTWKTSTGCNPMGGVHITCSHGCLLRQPWRPSSRNSRICRAAKSESMVYPRVKKCRLVGWSSLPHMHISYIYDYLCAYQYIYINTCVCRIYIYIYIYT